MGLMEMKPPPFPHHLNNGFRMVLLLDIKNSGTLKRLINDKRIEEDIKTNESSQQVLVKPPDIVIIAKLNSGTL